MKLLINIIIASALVLSFGCATKPNPHQGKYAKAEGAQGKRLKSGLTISARELEPYSSKHFTILEVMLENYTSDWITVKNLKTNFGNDLLNKNLKIVTGQNLINWAEAMNYNIKTKKLKKGSVPRTHVLGGDFRIPPGISVTRWIVVYLKAPFENPYFNTLKLNYQAGNAKEEATIGFRGAKTRSNFQWAHPGA